MTLPCDTECTRNNVLAGTNIPCRPIVSPTCDHNTRLLINIYGTLTDVPCTAPCVDNFVGGSRQYDGTMGSEDALPCNQITYIRYLPITQEDLVEAEQQKNCGRCLDIHPNAHYCSNVETMNRPEFNQVGLLQRSGFCCTGDNDSEFGCYGSPEFDYRCTNEEFEHVLKKPMGSNIYQKFMRYLMCTNDEQFNCG